VSCSVCSQTGLGKVCREELVTRGKPKLLEVAGPDTVQLHLLLQCPSYEPHLAKFLSTAPEMRFFSAGLASAASPPASSSLCCAGCSSLVFCSCRNRDWASSYPSAAEECQPPPRPSAELNRPPV